MCQDIFSSVSRNIKQATHTSRTSTIMQSTIKSFFGKNANSSTSSISTANTSSLVTPVKLVSYITTNSPSVAASRPLKRKTPDSRADYETNKRNRRYCPHWKESYPWLQYDATIPKMWCDVCREYKHTLKNKKHKSNQFIKGSSCWKLEKVREHNTSDCHTQCMETKASTLNPHDRPMDIGLRKMSSEQEERYTLLFNIAFTVAKHNFSFRQFEVLCRLQLKNKFDIGTNYQNAASCAQFIKSIAAVQRQGAAEIISKSRFIAVMADGSTDRSVAEQESVFIRYVCNGEPTNRFIALVELTSGNADGVIKAIDTALDLVGVGIDEQRNKLVNINLDGASVNMGILQWGCNTTTDTPWSPYN